MDDNKGLHRWRVPNNHHRVKKTLNVSSAFGLNFACLLMWIIKDSADYDKQTQ